MSQSKNTAASRVEDLQPGRYIRRWAGYDTVVEIRRRPDGSLVEVGPRIISAPETMPDAVWHPSNID